MRGDGGRFTTPPPSQLRCRDDDLGQLDDLGEADLFVEVAENLVIFEGIAECEGCLLNQRERGGEHDNLLLGEQRGRDLQFRES